VQAARDEIDREHIKRNEFGWLLKHKIAALEDEGTLPPRFAGLAGGGMKRQICCAAPPSKRKKDAAEDTGAAAFGGRSRTPPAHAGSGGGGGGGGGSVGGGGGDGDKEYYSRLARPPASAAEAEAVSEKGKRSLLRRWLRRKLFDEVSEQVGSLRLVVGYLWWRVPVVEGRGSKV
jgi:hypothetical protein